MNATRDFPSVGTTDDVSKFIKCSKAHVRELVRTKHLNAFLAGRSLRFTRDSVERFIAEREGAA